LTSCFEAQQKTLEKHFNDLKLSVLGNVAMATEKWSLETVRKSEESEKRLLDALNR
jgi:hypothetical protein